MGVVFQQFPAEPSEHSGIESVDVIRRRSESHLGISKVKDYMLPLIPNIVLLKPKEKSQPIQQVHRRMPLGIRRLPEVPDSA